MTRSRELAELASAYDSGGGLGFRNRIINGDCRIDQRSNGAAVTVNLSQFFYTVDRWGAGGVSSAGVFTVQRLTNQFPFAANAVRITVTTSATPATNATYNFQQRIEGFNIADLAFGTSAASAVTVSFKVRSSLTGTFSGVIQNGAQNRSYPFTYTISAANTSTSVSVTIPGDVTGTWAQDNTTGMIVILDLGSGASVRGSSGSWQGTSLFGAAGAASLISTVGATMDFAEFQIEAGTVATPFERRDYGRELMMCQRYYCHSNGTLNAPDVNTAFYLAAGLASDIEDAALTSVMFPSLMRATPSMTVGRMYSFDGSKYKTITSISPSAQGIGYLTHDAGNSGAAYVMGRPYKFSWIASAEL